MQDTWHLYQTKNIPFQEKGENLAFHEMLKRLTKNVTLMLGMLFFFKLRYASISKLFKNTFQYG